MEIKHSERPPSGLPARLTGALEQVIAGQTHQLKLILATMLSGGHVLLQDRPGVGKTVLAKALGTILGVPSSRIQGTPDLLPTDVTGVNIFRPDTIEWEFRAGPIFASLVLVDELNRATPKAQSALLEAMSEGSVTVDGVTRSLGFPFLVIATQNPLGEVGTHPLGMAQLDRFATMLELGLPGPDAELSIIRGDHGANHLDDLAPLLRADKLAQVFQQVLAVQACESVLGFILATVNAVRALDPSIWLSVRVGETMLRVARGWAFMNNRDYVAPEDIQAVAPAVLAHRLPRSLDPEAVKLVLAELPVPAVAH